jgi:hypothetical protein
LGCFGCEGLLDDVRIIVSKAKSLGASFEVSRPPDPILFSANAFLLSFLLLLWF